MNDLQIEWVIMKGRISNLWDTILRKIAWKIPLRIAYWVAFRMAAHATTGKWGNQDPDTLKFFTMIDRWEEQE